MIASMLRRAPRPCAVETATAAISATLDRYLIDRLRALRRPGQSYDVILRLAKG
jgi:hypothetical protein